MNTQNIFPTPIGYFNDVEFTNKVLPIANSILDKTGEHYWGYTSTFNDGNVQEYLKSFDWITSYIKKISYQFVEKISFTFKSEIEINTLFVSKIKNTQNHGRHTHPDSILSGVIYLETTPNCAPLVFEDPRPVREFNNMRRTKDKYLTNMDSIGLVPKGGDIVIFESWVPHSVPIMFKKGYRKTLVFNINYVNGEQNN